MRHPGQHAVRKRTRTPAQEGKTSTDLHHFGQRDSRRLDGDGVLQRDARRSAWAAVLLYAAAALCSTLWSSWSSSNPSWGTWLADAAGSRQSEPVTCVALFPFFAATLPSTMHWCAWDYEITCWPWLLTVLLTTAAAERGLILTAFRHDWANRKLPQRRGTGNQRNHHQWHQRYRLARVHVPTANHRWKRKRHQKDSKTR